MGDFDVVEEEEVVVYGVVVEFGIDVVDLYVGKRFVCFEIFDWDNERVRFVMFVVDDELSYYYGVVGNFV